ncbi:DUF4240 domain-containing protein [Krasilnikovia cinnamomea]|nr:DUF4240 domain-containing protein [Krasilnikovia cinnamomea]
MDEIDFWRLVQTLGRNPDDEAFDRLTARLAARSEADLIGFADRLASVLWALDTPAHFTAARTASDDAFLYIRCAVVAAGQKAFDRVSRNPAALGKFAGDEAELLLTVAERAYEQSTGRLWEHETPVSYETGSNTAAWGETAGPGPDASATAAPWLGLSFGSASPGGPPAAYTLLLREVVTAVASDPAWQRWWAEADVPLCELSLVLDGTGHTAPETTVKRGRKRIRVQVVRNPGPFPAAEPAALLAIATDEIRELLELAREHVGLGLLPPLPAPPLPVDLPAERFEPDAGLEIPPELPDELLERAIREGGLGPQDIIEYFRDHPNAEGAARWLNGH